MVKFQVAFDDFSILPATQVLDLYDDYAVEPTGQLGMHKVHIWKLVSVGAFLYIHA